MIFVIRIAANAISQAPHAFLVFEHFSFCTWSFAEYLNNYHMAVKDYNTLYLWLQVQIIVKIFCIINIFIPI